MTDIKKLLKPSILRSKTFHKFVKATRIWKAARTEGIPFNGDPILIRAVEILITQCNITHFVETGTYLGHTCRFIASRHPALQITTIEINQDFFETSKIVLKRFKNVKLLQGNSAEILNSILAGGEIRGLPLFFLDAHWYDYLPLPAEMQCIGKHLPSAIIVIHDFQVPGREDYGFDSYNGRAIGLGMLKDSLLAGREYELFLPKYTYQDVCEVEPATNQKLRGYAVLFQDAKGAVSSFSQCGLETLYTRQSIEVDESR